MCKVIQPMVRLLAALEMKHTQVTQNWTQMFEVSASCARSDVSVSAPCARSDVSVSAPCARSDVLVSAPCARSDV